MLKTALEKLLNPFALIPMQQEVEEKNFLLTEPIHRPDIYTTIVEQLPLLNPKIKELD